MENRKYPIVYGVRTKNKKILFTSSSGGVFSEIANYAISKKIIVYGCILDDKLNVTYFRGKKEEDIEKMRTSKYVQSNLINVVNNVKKDLIKNRVLFISTPCYVSYVKSKLSKEENSNLLTIDFICHGTPSVIFFKEHIKYLEKIYNSKIKNYIFRDKRYGWSHDEFAILENGNKIQSIKHVHHYQRLFHKSYILNSSCFSCKYTNIKRNSDFTIGDFWGVERKLKIYDNKGMSVLLINSDEGLKIFNKLKDNLEYYLINISDLKHGPLRTPTQKPKDYENFINDYREYGYEYVAKKYASATIKIYFSTIRRRIVHILKLDYLLFWTKYRIKELLNES